MLEPNSFAVNKSLLHEVSSGPIVPVTIARQLSMGYFQDGSPMDMETATAQLGDSVGSAVSDSQ